ncbi:hypothetical protein WME90_42650 [Sorangium sp. So ce375]|uniref:hypothetical protein n=1 Tax=Sorangium sp. So ce375 TaxID=3133306 RepID=UPI003F5C4387
MAGIVVVRVAGHRGREEAHHHIAQEREGQPTRHRAITQQPLQLRIGESLDHALDEVNEIDARVVADLLCPERGLLLKRVGEQGDFEGQSFRALDRCIDGFALRNPADLDEIPARMLGQEGLDRQRRGHRPEAGLEARQALVRTSVPRRVLAEIVPARKDDADHGANRVQLREVVERLGELLSPVEEGLFERVEDQNHRLVETRLPERRREAIGDLGSELHAVGLGSVRGGPLVLGRFAGERRERGPGDLAMQVFGELCGEEPRPAIR